MYKPEGNGNGPGACTRRKYPFFIVSDSPSVLSRQRWPAQKASAVCLLWTERKHMVNARNFVSLGLLKIFDRCIDVFLLAIEVVPDRLRITQGIVSPKHKSVITFTFVLGCM